MSEHKQARVVSSVNAGMVVGGGKHHRRRLHIKLWGALLLAIVIVVVAVCLIRYYDHHKHQDSAKGSSGSTSSTELGINTVDKDQSIAHQALGLALNGKTADAQQLLDNAIAKTTDKVEKGSLYEQKSTIAYGTKDYSKGLQYAQKAESLNPTANSANWIAVNAQALGNKTLALKYYKLELQRLQPSPVQNGNGQANIEAQIKALGGQ